MFSHGVACGKEQTHFIRVAYEHLVFCSRLSSSPVTLVGKLISRKTTKYLYNAIIFMRFFSVWYGWIFWLKGSVSFFVKCCTFRYSDVVSAPLSLASFNIRKYTFPWNLPFTNSNLSVEVFFWSCSTLSALFSIFQFKIAVMFLHAQNCFKWKSGQNNIEMSLMENFMKLMHLCSLKSN